MTNKKYKKINTEQNPKALTDLEKRSIVVMEKIELSIPFFIGYIIPNGYLDSHRESHALWYYYVNARRTYETHIKDVIALEGDKDPEYNFQELFKSIARMYGIEPHAMAKCWEQIDKQATLLGLPLLPDEERFRFARKIQLN